MKWTLCFLLTLCCCAQSASFISRYLGLFSKLNVFTKLRPDIDPTRWQFYNGTVNKILTATGGAISESSAAEESLGASGNDTIVPDSTNGAALQIAGIADAANDVIGGQSDADKQPTQENVKPATDDYEEDYDPSLFIEDDARSLAKWRSANKKRVKRAISFTDDLLYRNGQYGADSYEQIDFDTSQEK